MSAPAPAEVQTMCAQLHADYCALTRRPTPLLPGFARLWWDLLQSAEYAYDVECFGADVAHVVRYLQLGIRDAKRNAGALKLANFLQPDKYWEDLAEARATLRPAKPAKAARSAAEQPAPDAGSDETRLIIAQGLRKFLDGGLR